MPSHALKAINDLLANPNPVMGSILLNKSTYNIYIYTYVLKRNIWKDLQQYTVKVHAVRLLLRMALLQFDGLLHLEDERHVSRVLRKSKRDAQKCVKNMFCKAWSELMFLSCYPLKIGLAQQPGLSIQTVLQGEEKRIPHYKPGCFLCGFGAPKSQSTMPGGPDFLGSPEVPFTGGTWGGHLSPLRGAQAWTDIPSCKPCNQSLLRSVVHVLAVGTKMV